MHFSLYVISLLQCLQKTAALIIAHYVDVEKSKDDLVNSTEARPFVRTHQKDSQQPQTKPSGASKINNEDKH